MQALSLQNNKTLPIFKKKGLLMFTSVILNCSSQVVFVLFKGSGEGAECHNLTVSLNVVTPPLSAAHVIKLRRLSLATISGVGPFCFIFLLFINVLYFQILSFGLGVYAGIYVDQHYKVRYLSLFFYVKVEITGVKWVFFLLSALCGHENNFKNYRSFYS